MLADGRRPRRRGCRRAVARRRPGHRCRRPCVRRRAPSAACRCAAARRGPSLAAPVRCRPAGGAGAARAGGVRARLGRSVLLRRGGNAGPPCAGRRDAGSAGALGLQPCRGPARLGAVRCRHALASRPPARAPAAAASPRPAPAGADGGWPRAGGDCRVRHRARVRRHAPHGAGAPRRAGRAGGVADGGRGRTGDLRRSQRGRAGGAGRGGSPPAAADTRPCRRSFCPRRPDHQTRDPGADAGSPRAAARAVPVGYRGGLRLRRHRVAAARSLADRHCHRGRPGACRPHPHQCRGARRAPPAGG